MIPGLLFDWTITIVTIYSPSRCGAGHLCPSWYDTFTWDTCNISLPFILTGNKAALSVLRYRCCTRYFTAKYDTVLWSLAHGPDTRTFPSPGCSTMFHSTIIRCLRHLHAWNLRSWRGLRQKSNARSLPGSVDRDASKGGQAVYKSVFYCLESRLEG